MLVNKKLRQGEPQLYASLVKLLGYKLYDITRVVPAPALAKLRRIAILGRTERTASSLHVLPSRRRVAPR